MKHLSLKINQSTIFMLQNILNMYNPVNVFRKHDSLLDKNIKLLIVSLTMTK